MTLPVAPGTDQMPASSPVAPAAEIRIARVDGPLQGLTPGSILQVSVRRDPNFGTGVMINGEFVRASVPDSVPNGAQLLVRVLPTSDALILKISSEARLRGEQLIAQSFEAILGSLLPDLKVEDLKKGLPPQLPIGTELATLLQSMEAGPAAAKAPASDSAIGRIFQNLLKSNALIGETLLNNPSSLQTALGALAKGEGLEDVRQALAKISRETQNPIAAPVIRFLKAFEEHLAGLIKDLSASASPAVENEPQQIAEQMKLYLAASQTAMQNGNTGALQQLSRDVGRVRNPSDPLSFMLGLFRHLELPEQGDALPQQQQLNTSLKQLAQELRKIKDSNPQPAALKDLLKGMQDKATSTRKQLEGGSGHEGELTPQAQKVLKGIESIMQAQASLVQVNPVMQALGEPALVLLPALVQGIFGAWKVSVREEPADGEAEGKGAAKQFVRISVALTLPSLGPLEVEIAHRKGEALVHIASTSQEATEIITKRTPALEKALVSLGYSKTTLSASTGALKHTLPGWYTELSRRSIIA